MRSHCFRVQAQRLALDIGTQYLTLESIGGALASTGAFGELRSMSELGTHLGKKVFCCIIGDNYALAA